MNAVPKQSPQSKGWSPERRARQSAMMRARKIWLKSTGPKTAAGKAKSAANANARWGHNPDRMVREALRTHGRFLRDFNLYVRARKEKIMPCELLKEWEARLTRQGNHATKSLTIALTAVTIMQKSCFLGRSPYKS